MKKGNANHSYLFMAGVVAIVAIVALVLNGGGSLQGAVSSEGKLCTDDDPEDDFYLKGTVNSWNKVYEDYCLSDKDLIQHFCQTGRDVKTRRAYSCPEGCLNGACLRG